MLSKRLRFLDETHFPITRSFTPGAACCKVYSEVARGLPARGAKELPCTEWPRAIAVPLVSPELKAAYERRLDLAKVPAAQRPDYHKWVRFFLCFCQKFGYGPNLPTSRGPFLNKLTSVKTSN